MAYRMATQPLARPEPKADNPPSTAAPLPVPDATPVAPAATTALPGQSTTVLLRHLGTGPARLMGPVTGRRYDVSPAQPDFAAEPRDAAVLVRQSLARRV